MLATVTLFKRELKSFFVSPGGYIIFAAFLLLSSYFFGTLLQYYQELVRVYNIAPMQMSDTPPNLDADIVQAYLHFLILMLLFFLPVLCMRSFAEEKRAGTFELLLISPLKLSSIVCAKCLALSAVLAAMLLLASWCPLLLGYFGPVDLLSFSLGMCGVFLYAVALIAILIAVAVFCGTALLSAFAGMVTLLLIYLIDTPASAIGPKWGNVLRYLTPRMHVEEFVQGIFSLGNCVYFLSLIALSLILATTVLKFERFRV